MEPIEEINFLKFVSSVKASQTIARFMLVIYSYKKHSSKKFKKQYFVCSGAVASNDSDIYVSYLQLV